MKIPRLFKTIAFGTCCIFTANTICLSAPAAYTFQVSEKYATVSERWRGAPKTAEDTAEKHGSPSEPSDEIPQLSANENRTVIIIQDAHDNYDAQINIAGIIEDIARGHNTPHSLDAPRVSGESPREVLAELTPLDEESIARREGVVHTPPMTSDPSQSVLIGIEGAIGALDLSDIRRYPIPEARRKSAEQLLKEGYLTGAEYAAASSEVPIPIWGIEDKDLFRANFALFFKILSHKEAIEEYLNERRRALERAKEAVCAPQVLSFLATLEAYETEQISFGDYFVRLNTYAAEVGIDPAEYTQVMLFHEVLREGHDSEGVLHEGAGRSLSYKNALLDYGALLREVRALAYRIARELAATRREKEIIGEAREITLLEKMLLLRATREEVAEWTEAFSSQVSSDSEETALTHAPYPPRIQDIMPVVREFYRLAEKRDSAMLANLLAKMDETDTDVGIVIAGGYHSEGIKALLRERGIAYVVITPHISETNILRKIGYMDRMLGHIAPIDPVLTSYINPTLFGNIADLIDQEGLDAAFLQNICATLAAEKHTAVSRINANMEAICGQAGRDTIRQYFADVWSQELIDAPDWAAVIMLLKDDPAVASDVRRKANAIYELARLKAKDLSSHGAVPDAAGLDAFMHENMFIRELGELLRESPEAVLFDPDLKTDAQKLIEPVVQDGSSSFVPEPDMQRTDELHPMIQKVYFSLSLPEFADALKLGHLPLARDGETVEKTMIADMHLSEVSRHELLLAFDRPELIARGIELSQQAEGPYVIARGRIPLSAVSEFFYFDIRNDPYVFQKIRADYDGDEVLAGRVAAFEDALQAKTRAIDPTRFTAVKDVVIALIKESYTGDTEHGLRHARDIFERMKVLAREQRVLDRIDWDVLEASAYLHDLFMSLDLDTWRQETYSFIDANLAHILSRRQRDYLKRIIELNLYKDRAHARERKEAGIEAELLYDADNWDSFGERGVYRYIARFHKEGMSKKVVAATVRDKIKRRYESLSSDEVKKLIRNDYVLARAFFDELSLHEDDRTIIGVEGVYNLITDHVDMHPVEAGYKALERLESLSATQANNPEYRYAVRYFNALILSYNKRHDIIHLSPSFLDVKEGIAEKVEILEHAGVQLVHIDHFDGVLSPEAFDGFALAEKIVAVSDIAMDVHLIVKGKDEILRQIDKYVALTDAIEVITFHREAVKDETEFRHIIDYLHARGMKAGVALNPKTEFEVIRDDIKKYGIDYVLVMTVEPGYGGQSFHNAVVPKIQEINDYIVEENLDVNIIVDGGIKQHTIGLAVDAGADILVSGSGIFGSGDIFQSVGMLFRGAGLDYAWITNTLALLEHTIRRTRSKRELITLFGYLDSLTTQIRASHRIPPERLARIRREIFNCVEPFTLKKSRTNELLAAEGITKETYYARLLEEEEVTLRRLVFDIMRTLAQLENIPIDHRIYERLLYTVVNTTDPKVPQSAWKDKDPDAGVRVRAAEALGAIRSTGAFSHLLGALKNTQSAFEDDSAFRRRYEDDPRVRVALVNALKDILEPFAIKADQRYAFQLQKVDDLIRECIVDETDQEVKAAMQSLLEWTRAHLKGDQTDMPAMALIINDRKQWEQPRLSQDQHSVINKAWSRMFDEDYEPKDFDDPVREDVVELLRKADVLEDKEVHIHIPPDELLYDTIYDIADKYNIAFPSRGNFLLLTHPGTFRDSKTGEPRSFNVLIPESVYVFLKDASENDGLAYYQWLEHEFNHLMDNARGVERDEETFSTEYPVDYFIDAYLDYRKVRAKAQKQKDAISLNIRPQKRNVSARESEADLAYQDAASHPEVDHHRTIAAIALEKTATVSIGDLSTFFSAADALLAVETARLEVEADINRYGMIDAYDVPRPIVICSDMNRTYHGTQRIRFDLARDPHDETRVRLRISVFDRSRAEYVLTNIYTKAVSDTYPVSLRNANIKEEYLTRFRSHVEFFCTKGYLSLDDEHVVLQDVARIDENGQIALFDTGQRLQVASPGNETGQSVDLRLFTDPIHGTVLECRVGGRALNYYYYNSDGLLQHVREYTGISEDDISLALIDLRTYLDGDITTTPRLERPFVFRTMIDAENTAEVLGRRVQVARKEVFQNTIRNIRCVFRTYSGADPSRAPVVLEVAINKAKSSQFVIAMILGAGAEPVNHSPLPAGFNAFSRAKQGIYLAMRYGADVLSPESPIGFDAGVANVSGQVNCFNDGQLSLMIGRENSGKDAYVRYFHSLDHGAIFACEVDDRPVNYYYRDENGTLMGMRKAIVNTSDYITLTYLDILRFFHSDIPLKELRIDPLLLRSYVYHDGSIHVHGIGYVPVFRGTAYRDTLHTFEFLMSRDKKDGHCIEVYHLREGSHARDHLVTIKKDRATQEIYYKYDEANTAQVTTKEERAIASYLAGETVRVGNQKIRMNNAGTVGANGTLSYSKLDMTLYVGSAREGVYVGEQVDLELFRDRNLGNVLACLVNGSAQNFYYKTSDGQMQHLRARELGPRVPISLTYLDFLRLMEGKVVHTSEGRTPFEITRHVHGRKIALGSYDFPVFEHVRFTDTSQTFLFTPRPNYGAKRVYFEVARKKEDGEFETIAQISQVEKAAGYELRYSFIGDLRLSQEQRAIRMFIEKQETNLFAPGQDELYVAEAGTVNRKGNMVLFTNGAAIKIGKGDDLHKETVSLRLFHDVIHGVVLEASIKGIPVNYHFLDEDGALKNVYSMSMRQDSTMTLTYLDMHRFLAGRDLSAMPARVPFDVPASIAYGGTIKISGLAPLKVVDHARLFGRRKMFRFLFAKDARGKVVLKVFMKDVDQDESSFELVARFIQPSPGVEPHAEYIERDQGEALSEVLPQPGAAEEPAGAATEKAAPVRTGDPQPKKKKALKPAGRFAPQKKARKKPISKSVPQTAQEISGAGLTKTDQAAKDAVLTYLQGKPVTVPSEGDGEGSGYEYLVTGQNITEGRIRIPHYGRLTVAKRRFYTGVHTVRLRLVERANLAAVLEVAVQEEDGEFHASAYYFHELNDRKENYADGKERVLNYFFTERMFAEGVSDFETLEALYFLTGYTLAIGAEARSVQATSRIAADGSLYLSFRKLKKKIIAAPPGLYTGQRPFLRLYDDPNHGTLLAISVLDGRRHVTTNYYYQDDSGEVLSLRNVLQSHASELSLAGLDILSFMRGKPVKPIPDRTSYTSQGIVRSRGLVNLPFLSEVPIATKNKYTDNDRHVDFRFFTDPVYGHMVECSVSGTIENYFFHSEDGEVKHFRNKDFSHYYWIRTLYEFDLARYLDGFQFETLPERQDEAGRMIRALDIRQKVKKGRLTFFYAKNIHIGHKYNNKDLRLQLVNNPKRGIVILCYADEGLIGLLQYDREKEAPFFTPLSEGLSGTKKKPSDDKKVKETKKSEDLPGEGYIYKGERSIKAFEKRLSAIRATDSTAQYRKELFRIVKTYGTHLPEGLRNDLFKKIRSMTVYGFRSIVTGSDDFMLGKYDASKNELFLAQDIMRELEVRGPPSLRDEYLLHELLCAVKRTPDVSYAEAHHAAIALQKSVFPAHYQLETMPAPAATDSRRFKEKGLLGRVLRNCIDIKIGYRKNRFLLREADGFLRILTATERTELLNSNEVVKVHVLQENSLMEHSMEYISYAVVDARMAEGKLYLVWRDNKKKQVFGFKLFEDTRAQGKILTVDDEDGRPRHMYFNSQAAYARTSTPYHYEELLEMVNAQLKGKSAEVITQAYVSAYNYWGLRRNSSTKQYEISRAIVRALNIASVAPRHYRDKEDAQPYVHLIAAALIYGIPGSKLSALDPRVVSLAQKVYFISDEIRFQPDQARRSRYYLQDFKNMIKDMISTPEELLLYLYTKVEQFENTRYMLEHSEEEPQKDGLHDVNTEYEEAIHVVAALASDYGLSDLAREIKKKYFKEYDYPEYIRIKKMRNDWIQMSKETAYAYRDHLRSELERYMAEKGFAPGSLTIGGRVKDPISIAEKLERGYTIESMFDLFAFRIVVNTKDALNDCWKIRSFFDDESVLGLQDTERYDDFISRPRRGYQSLQLGFIHDVDTEIIERIKREIGEDGYSPDLIDIELQIRTAHMDRFARFGSAADAIKKAIERGHRHYMITYASDIGVDLEKNISEIKKQLLIADEQDAISYVYLRSGADIIRLKRTEEGPTPLDVLAHRSRGEGGLHFEELELVTRAKQLNELKKTTVLISRPYGKHKGKNRLVQALSWQLRSGDKIAVLRGAANLTALETYREILFPWASLNRTKVLVRLLGRDRGRLIREGRSALSHAIPEVLRSPTNKRKLLAIADLAYDLDENLLYLAIGVGLFDVAEVKLLYDSFDMRSLGEDRDTPPLAHSDGMISEGERSLSLFRSLQEQGVFDDVSELYRARLRRIVDAARTTLPIAIYETLIERLDALSVYEFRALVQAQDDFVLGYYAADENALCVASDLVDVLNGYGLPSLVDEYLLHELICPLMQQEYPGRYKDAHHAAIRLQKTLFPEHYQVVEPESAVQKGLLGKALTAFIRDLIRTDLHIEREPTVLVPETAQARKSPQEFSLSDDELADIITFFAAYPRKLDYIHNSADGMPVVIKPVYTMVEKRMQLYRAIQAGDIARNIARIRDRAYAERAHYPDSSPEYRSIEYELSLLGVSPIDGTIHVPEYLTAGESGLSRQTAVSVPTVPRAGDWTHAVGVEEELVRYRLMQESFDPGRYNTVLFSKEEFELDVQQLGVVPASFFRNKRILEVGARYGALMRYIQEFSRPKEYVGLDVDLLSLSGPVYAANNKVLPFADDSFDIILLNNFIGPYYEEELKRVLRQKGSILVTGDPVKYGGLQNGLYAVPRTKRELDQVRTMPYVEIADTFQAWLQDSLSAGISRSLKEMTARLLSLIDAHEESEALYASAATLQKLCVLTLGRYALIDMHIVQLLPEAIARLKKARDYAGFAAARSDIMRMLDADRYLSAANKHTLIDLLGLDRVQPFLSDSYAKDDDMYYEFSVCYRCVRPGLLSDIFSVLRRHARVEWFERLHEGDLRYHTFGVRMPKHESIEELFNRLRLIEDYTDHEFEKMPKQKWILEISMPNTTENLAELTARLAAKKIRLSAFLPPVEIHENTRRMRLEIEVPQLFKEDVIYNNLSRFLSEIGAQIDIDADVILVPGTLIERVVYEFISEIDIDLSAEQMARVHLALHVIGRRHLSKVRKNRINSYISHFTKVAKIVVNQFGVQDPDVLIAALLHDTLEDGILAPEKLLALFKEDVFQMVKLVTRYEEKAEGGEKIYFRRISDSNDTAITARVRSAVLCIKIADRIHNLRTLRVGKRDFERSVYFATLDTFIPELMYRLQSIPLDPEYPLSLARAFVAFNEEVVRAGYELGFITDPGFVRIADVWSYYKTGGFGQFVYLQNIIFSAWAKERLRSPALLLWWAKTALGSVFPFFRPELSHTSEELEHVIWDDELVRKVAGRFTVRETPVEEIALDEPASLDTFIGMTADAVRTIQKRLSTLYAADDQYERVLLASQLSARIDAIAQDIKNTLAEYPAYYEYYTQGGIYADTDLINALSTIKHAVIRIARNPQSVGASARVIEEALRLLKTVLSEQLPDEESVHAKRDDDGALIHVGDDTVEGYAVRWLVPLTRARHEGLSAGLRGIIQEIHDDYYGFLFSFQRENGYFVIEDRADTVIVDDGRIHIDQAALERATDSSAARQSLINTVILPALLAEDTNLATVARESLVEIDFERVPFSGGLIGYLVQLSLMMHEGITHTSFEAERKGFSRLLDSAKLLKREDKDVARAVFEDVARRGQTDPVAFSQMLFLKNMLVLFLRAQQTGSAVDKDTARDLLRQVIARREVKTLWSEMAKALAEVQAYIESQHFANQLIAYEDEAIDASRLAESPNRSARIAALRALYDKASRLDLRAFKIFADERIRRQSVFPFLEKIIHTVKMTGIDITFVDTHQDADLILAFSSEAGYDHNKTFLFDPEDEQRFFAQLALFRSVFMRLVNESISHSGEIAVDMTSFNLLEAAQHGFAIHPKIVDNLNSDIIDHFKARIIRVAA